jgi:two-component system, OmpR family, response regulator
MANRHSIFLVEDDPNFGGVLKAYLEMNNYQVYLVNDGKDALSLFKKGLYSICILDVMLPNLDGYSLAKRIKEIEPEIPLIFLTAKSLKADQIQGYQLGADDFITKPFDSEVLLYKIKAIIKRDRFDNEAIEQNHIFEIGNYQFDYQLRKIVYENQIIKLSPKEADLLKMLCIAENKVLPRIQTLKTIWGDDNYFTTRSMDVYITKLRKYLKNDTRIEIENIHGSGFRLLLKK